jgi:CDP-diacylglycerol--serine O-phosphatidyltransferase
MKKHIPNAITCLNLLSGCVGVVLAFKFPEKLQYASYAIFIAAILDFLDGMVARLLRAYSEIGKELDSLADMVSFGVLPSVIVYHLFLQAPQLDISPFLNYTAFLIAIFSALRLAKFNIDERQTENFIGLPTPANAMLIASFPLIVAQGDYFSSSFIKNPYFLSIFSLGMGLLLVMELPLMSLKFRNFALNQNIYRYIIITASIVLLLILKFVAVPVILFLYIALSLIQFRIAR